MRFTYTTPEDGIKILLYVTNNKVAKTAKIVEVVC